MCLDIRSERDSLTIQTLSGGIDMEEDNLGNYRNSWVDIIENISGISDSEIFIQASTILPYGCTGYVENRHTKDGKDRNIFFLRYIPKVFLIVSMLREEQSLINDFAEIVELQPFCRYVSQDGLVVFEWTWLSPVRRFPELIIDRENGGIKDLQIIQ